MFKWLVILFSYWSITHSNYAEAKSSLDNLWKTIQSDTFPYQYQYEEEKIIAQKMLEELSAHLQPHSGDYDNTLKTVLIYQALAGNTRIVDSLIQVKSKLNSSKTNELIAHKLFIEWLPCSQFSDSETCKKKTKALQDFLKNNFITENPDEAMKWHWVAKMINDSVLIDHKNTDFTYSPQLAEKDNPPAFDGAVLSTQRTLTSTNVLISHGYREPIQLFELDKKGNWMNVTKAALLDNIPGGQRLYSVDINNDGCQDIMILRNIPSGRLAYLYPSLLINQGNGTYIDVSHEGGFDVPQRSTCACFFDANEDGKLDIFLGGEGYGSLLFLQDENNKFKESSNALGIITKPYKVVDCTAFDINHDGKHDLLLSTYNHTNIVYEYQKINEQYPFFIDKSIDYNFYLPYKGGKFIVGDFDGDQSVNIISNTDHSLNDKDVVFNILSGSYGPDEFPVMWDPGNFNISETTEQYPLLTYSNVAINIDKGNSRPYILFGGGKQWDELYPMTLYQFLDDHYFYQLTVLENQPNYVSSMTVTPHFKTQQPVIWMKGGFPNTILKNKISTYLQSENGGKFFTINLTGKSRKDALGTKITVTTTDESGKETKRTRIIQATDSYGNGAGQNIWFVPNSSKITGISINWNNGKEQSIQDISIRKPIINIIEE